MNRARKTLSPTPAAAHGLELAREIHRCVGCAIPMKQLLLCCAVIVMSLCLNSCGLLKIPGNIIRSVTGSVR